MSLRDFIDVNSSNGPLTRELLERSFEQKTEPHVCERCGYETDAEGYCVFCGHLTHWRRSR